ELQIVQNCGLWAVMHEFGALVEEGGVVLVRLDDKVLRRTRPGGNLQVGGDAADEEAGIFPGAFQDPGEHRRSARLAMGSGDSQYPLTIQYMLCKPLRAGLEPIAAIEDRLHQRVAAGNDVADHPEVWREPQLVGAVAFD